MASPQNNELLSFRRTFTLLILLVVLPSAGLSGFGVVAIVNERAAVEKRIEASWSGRLTAMSGELRTALESAHIASVEPALKLTSGDLVLTAEGFVVEQGQIICADSHLKAAVSSLGSELDSVPEHPVYFSVAAPQATWLVAAVRRGPRVVGAQLSMGALDALLAKPGARLAPPGEGRFGLRPVKREVADSIITEVREAALGPRELASLTLPSPLQDFRLVALAEGEDPVAQASTRNRAVYGILLGVFYITLALGVVFTGRTLYREARLSRLKTDFVSLVSHELRTPLTSIRMFIEMLALGRVKDPHEMQTVLDLLSKETARLSGMIENVLDWARIESGRKEYQRSPTPVKLVVDTAVQALRAQRVGSTLNLVVDVPEPLPDVDVDRDAIAGALLNLLQNAFKYSEDKRIELRARTDDDGVVLEVEDNGVGIARRELKRIFDRFYRVDGLLTRSTEGSGLGLSIAQRIVQAHGGRISVDSIVGKGSTFRIHLPQSRAS